MVATKLMTIEEFADLTDDNVHELVEGEVARMSPAGKTHLLIVSRIGWAIRDYSVLNGGFHGLTGEGGFVLRRNPDSVLAPDISIMTTAQVEAMDELSGTFSTVMPIIVIEVKSPNDRESQIARKLEIYLESGIGEVWWVRPERKEVTIHRPDSAPVLIASGESVTSPLLPGFALDSGTLFT